MNTAGEINSSEKLTAEGRFARRLIYGSIAVVATAIGLVGVWLPVLPTTPFILVALWAASRSSLRLARWLRRVPILRSAVDAADRYALDRSIALPLKILSQVMAYLAIGLVWIITRSPRLTIFGAICALASTIFMILTPTATNPKPTRQSEE